MMGNHVHTSSGLPAALDLPTRNGCGCDDPEMVGRVGVAPDMPGDAEKRGASSATAVS